MILNVTDEDESQSNVENLILNTELNIKKAHKLHPVLVGQLREMMKVLITIRRLQNAFYKEIINAVETLHLGRAIIQNLDFLEIYADFWILYGNFVTKGGFDVFMKASKFTANKIEKFLKKCVESDNEFKNRGKIMIGHLFDIIFQRLPKYELLLKEYIKEIPVAMPDSKIAKSALEKLKIIMTENNEKMGRTDCISILSKIQNPLDYTTVLEEQINPKSISLNLQNNHSIHETIDIYEREINKNDRKELIKFTKNLFDVKLYGYVNEQDDKIDNITDYESSENIPGTLLRGASGRKRRKARDAKTLIIIIGDTAFECVEKKIKLKIKKRFFCFGPQNPGLLSLQENLERHNLRIFYVARFCVSSALCVSFCAPLVFSASRFVCLSFFCLSHFVRFVGLYARLGL